MSDRDSTALDAYMRALRKLPRLTAEQTAELHVIGCDLERDLRERLVANNQLWNEALRLVVFAASKLTGTRSLPPDLDMIQEGNLAAAGAIGRWDPSKGAFSTWIVRSAHGAMVDYYRREQRNGTGGKDSPLPYMIALDASAGTLDDAEASDLPGTAEPEASPLYDALDLGWLESPECAAQRAQLRKIVSTIKAADVQRVLLRYYGLDGDVPQTLSEIAGHMQVSVGLVHKLLHKGYALLREKLS